jgi:opacity protein-like surface antigen
LGGERGRDENTVRDGNCRCCIKHHDLNFKTNVIATATGRIGYAVNFDSIAGLFYLKGGAAFVDYDTSTFNGQLTACAVFDSTKGTCTSGAVGSAVTFNAPSANRFGWTIGVGTEWAVFGEWDYLNLDSQCDVYRSQLRLDPSQC